MLILILILILIYMYLTFQKYTYIFIYAYVYIYIIPPLFHYHSYHTTLLPFTPSLEAPTRLLHLHPPRRWWDRPVEFTGRRKRWAGGWPGFFMGKRWASLGILWVSMGILLGGYFMMYLWVFILYDLYMLLGRYFIWFYDVIGIITIGIINFG